MPAILYHHDEFPLYRDDNGDVLAYSDVHMWVEYYIDDDRIQFDVEDVFFQDHRGRKLGTLPKKHPLYSVIQRTLSEDWRICEQIEEQIREEIAHDDRSDYIRDSARDLELTDR